MWVTPMKLAPVDSEDIKQLPSVDSSKYITVICRLKPLLPHEQKSKIEVNKINHSITLNDPTKSISKTYSFDQIFDECVCQDRFANSICQPLVRFLKNGGQSGLIFSYGITNSGKTYTILGTKQQPGIFLTLIKMLGDELKGQPLKIVACQLYKDEFMSLKNKGEKIKPKECKGIITFDECIGDIINESNMQQLFNQYLKNRSCSSTGHNSVSSRSHAIFKISTSKFKIGIVDLAGSQRTSKNQDQAHDVKETIFINSSLLTLKKCIKVLEESSNANKKVLTFPYRESKLTQALFEYFTVNSKINIIVNINQARHCLEQNLNVMDYTSKAKNITANATSDFSMMLKTTNKKKVDVVSAIKDYRLVKSNLKNQEFQSKSFVFNSKSAISKGLKFSQISQSSKNSQNSQNSLNSQHSLEIQNAYSELDSISEQNERKHSEIISTTINSHSPISSNPNILIQEIEYQQFNPIKQQNEHKIRYSVQFKGQDHKYIIDEEMIENEEMSTSLMLEIEAQERKSFIEKKQQEQMFEQLVEKPLSIQDFIKKQQSFRNYLAIDKELEAQSDARKLSALKKVNLLQSTKKKENLNEQIPKENQMMKQIKKANVAVGTENAFLRQTEDLNQKLANIEFQKLRTHVKRKLMKVLDEEKKKVLCDAFTSYSQRKVSKTEDKFDSMNIDETQLQNEESNYTTPRKNISKSKSKMNEKSSRNPQKSKDNGIFSMVKSGLKSGIKSGMKILNKTVNYVGFGNNSYRTNNKQINSSKKNHSEEKKQKNCNMQIWKEISEMVNPHNKIFYEFATNTEVDIFPSNKKVRLMTEHRRSKINEDGQIEIDGYPELVEEFVIQTFEVGIQTDQIQVKFAMQDAIQEAIQEQKDKKKKKDKKHKNDGEKPTTEFSIQQKKHQFAEKTAFKNFSIGKNDVSLNRRKAFASTLKQGIAKNTRGAQKKRQNQHN